MLGTKQTSSYESHWARSKDPQAFPLIDFFPKAMDKNKQAGHMHMKIMNPPSFRMKFQAGAVVVVSFQLNSSRFSLSILSQNE